MDLKQLTYIVKIAEEGSITKASEKLFISQSGLNQQLLKLESELGQQLFHRAKNDFRLTEAGEIYVDYARKILDLKEEAYNKLNDLANNQTGHLRLGLTPERGINMLMNVYPEFYRRFPNVTIEPTEIGIRRQLDLISRGYLDLGFVTLTENDKTNDEYIHIYYENILLAVPRSHPLAAHAAPPGEPFATADLSAFREEKFVLMFKDSTLRQVIDPLFREAGFAPQILFETSSNLTLRNMVKSKIACSLISHNYAREQEDVAYFYLPSRPMWELCATYKRGHYLTKAASEFLELAIRHYRKTAQENNQSIV